MTDEAMLYERWHWPHSDVMNLDFDDFITYSDGVKSLYEQEAKERDKQIAESRRRR